MIRHRRTILALAASLALLALAGCQFPGAGVSVSFTSPTPAEGARITGVSHPYALAVTVTVNGATPDSFALTNNGTKVTGVAVSGNTYTASVPLDDGANALVATATAAGLTYTATRHVYYPFLALQDGQDAGTVMGATSFTSAPSSKLTAIDLLYRPEGAPALVNGRLYIPDTGNNRAVGYTSLPSAPTGANFDILLGKPSGSWNNGDTPTYTSGDTLASPAGVGGAGSQLLVADTGNNRVLVWAATPTTSITFPVAYVGQTGLTGKVSACSRSGLDQPRAAFSVGGKLIVADTGNNRVLIWNAVPTSSGTQADLVLGQSGFTSCDANRSATPTTPTGSTLDQPSDVWSDGTRLIVADTDNNRVLIWNTFPTSNGAAADVVIGQNAMTTNGIEAADAPSPAVQTGLSGPRSMTSNGNQIFIADTGYNRVVVFDTFPSGNGAHADRVLGQSALNGGTSPNRGNTNPAANTLSGPRGVRAFDGYLIVADTQNSRELLYRPPAP